MTFNIFCHFVIFTIHQGNHIPVESVQLNDFVLDLNINSPNQKVTFKNIWLKKNDYLMRGAVSEWNYPHLWSSRLPSP